MNHFSARPSLGQHIPAELWLYTVAALLCALTLLARLAFDPLLGNQAPLLLFIMPVMLSAWYGGFGPGIFATLLSALAGSYLLLPPLFDLRVADLADQIRVAIFVGEGSLIATLSGGLRNALRRAEANALALGQSEERFHLLVDGVHDYAIFMIDPDGLVSSWNTGAERIKGYRADEIVGAPVARFYPPEGARAGMPARSLAEALAAGRYEEEGWRVRRDGSRFLAHVVITPLYSREHQLRGFAVVTRDVTALRHAEQEREGLLGQLETTRAFLEAVVQQIPAGLIIAAAPSGEVLLSNEETSRILSLGSRAVSEQPGVYTGALSLEGEPYAPEDYPLMRAARQHEVTHMQELLYRRDDGELLHLLANAAPIRDQGGHVIAAVSIFLDISQLKQTEAALARSEGQLAAIIDSAMDAIITVDEAQRIVRWNAAAEHMFGVAAGQAVGRPMDRFIPQRYRQDHRRHVEQFRATGDTARAMGHLRPLLAMRADGSEFPIEASISQVTVGGRKLLTVILRDITTRIEAEERLRASEERFATAFRASAAAMVISTMAEGRILDANDSFLSLFGRERDDVIGHASLDLEMWADPDERARAVELLRRDGSLRDLEVAIRAGDGEPRAVLISVNQITVDGQACLLTTIYDISERQRLEAQLLRAQKMDSVGQLAGGIAHDFNNLLTAIGGYAELALGDLRSSDPAYDELQEIVRASQRASALTRQLLTFARRQAFAPQLLALNDLVREIEKLLRRLIDARVELRLELADGLQLVRADPGQIEQVLTNLVLNARDAMPNGGAITITTANRTLGEQQAQGMLVQAGGYVTLAVADTGVGMPPEVQARLFEPFFTTKPPGKGTGLGLSTCYGIVKQHGGIIWVESTPGQGSRVTVYLPWAEGSLEPPAAELAPADLPRGHETVLLAEDEAPVRALAARVLRDCGYTVLEAGNGEEALALAEQYGPERIDLLVSDVVMPRMGGRQASESLRRLHPRLKVLFISGYTEHATIEEDGLAEGSLLLAKPFSPVALAQAVRAVLDG